MGLPHWWCGLGGGEACSGKARSHTLPKPASIPAWICFGSKTNQAPGALSGLSQMHTADNSSLEIFAHMPSCFINDNNLYGLSSENKQYNLTLLQVKWYWIKLNSFLHKDITQSSGLQSFTDLVLLVQAQSLAYQRGDLHWSFRFLICKMGVNTIPLTVCED